MENLYKGATAQGIFFSCAKLPYFLFLENLVWETTHVALKKSKPQTKQTKPRKTKQNKLKKSHKTKPSQNALPISTFGT